MIHLLLGILFAILFYIKPFHLFLFFLLCTFISYFSIRYIKEAYRVFWYFLGVSIITSLYRYVPIHVITSAMLVSAIGDSFSTLFGKRFGKKKFPYSDKTYIGTISGIIFSLIPLLFIQPLHIAFIGAISGIITETYSPINDNFSVPIAAFFAMYIAIKI